MKWINSLFILGLLMGLTACSPNEATQTQAFSQSSEKQLKERALCYSDEDFSQGVVPLHEFVKLSGTIVKSDAKTADIEKGNRFILETAAGQYQVFNEQSQQLKLQEVVTIYGEYYGFIKATLIERKDADAITEAAAIEKE
ncbi:hypothetical protein NGF69_04995 [Enterococcus casseliflavus]|uniref:Lipoprotein n=1 Tax=Enterococcus casseliflavus ATCC 12755 TaxID=888066 RepID=F0EFZ9_ENTCA|nr:MULTISPECIES: hypothetical protein [Enterococcus]EGC70719.1 hypothetical protein HMPREF9087_0096 [Enterococcus casseliflavus ATCC 12755]EPH67446.1 hypothetical protein D931_00185 [Enterococcus faecium 13.SD.W.09]MEC5314901.1 hypothetical protein [Enterococcus casseliflavus]OTO13003.1 hypothetical protein A5882_001400 [Enterococcus sp. 4E1_DIV0656]